MPSRRSLSRWAASERWDVTGVELSRFAADYARREFGHVVLTGDIADVPAAAQIVERKMAEAVPLLPPPAR